LVHRLEVDDDEKAEKFICKNAGYKFHINLLHDTNYGRAMEDKQSVDDVSTDRRVQLFVGMELQFSTVQSTFLARV